MAKREILYVPILKSKAGERWALSQLSSSANARIRPLLEFHPHKSKLVGDHIEGVCEALQAAWGVNRLFYVDTVWLSWQEGAGSNIKRIPTYSDYTMRPPGAPADFGEPSVNLRYALDDHWLVQMGGKHKDGAAVEIHAMASELVARPDYLGTDFSSGDEEIDRVTDEDEGPGGPTQWLQWCVNHHLEFVVQQLSPAAA